MIVEFFHSARSSVVETTNFGRLFILSANPASSFLEGQADAKTSYVTLPKRCASAVNNSSCLNFPISSLINWKTHFSGASATPSNETNSVTITFLISFSPLFVFRIQHRYCSVYPYNEQGFLFRTVCCGSSCRLTRARSATAGESELNLQWKC